VATNNYETVFIAQPEIAQEAVEDFLGKIKTVITSNQGAVTNEDRWGRRRLSYPIQGFREGFYVVLNYSAEAPAIAGLEHLFRVTDTVIRHMTVKIIKKNKTFKPRRVKSVGAVDSRPGARPGYNRDSRGSSSSAPAAASATTAPAAAPAPMAAPAAPEAETPGASA